jgi:ATP-dependent helicase YprA (DUF1998 family)
MSPLPTILLYYLFLLLLHISFLHHPHHCTRHFYAVLSQFSLLVYSFTRVGGYTKEERRVIEAELFSGRLLGVTATCALELGMDIGDLDVSDE